MSTGSLTSQHGLCKVRAKGGVPCFRGWCCSHSRAADNANCGSPTRWPGAAFRRHWHALAAKTELSRLGSPAAKAWHTDDLLSTVGEFLGVRLAELSMPPGANFIALQPSFI